MTPEEVRLLYDFNAWANRRTLDACAALSAEQFTRRIESSFPSVRDTLVHILGAEWLWLERWRGRSPGAAEVEPVFAGERYPDLQTVRARWETVERDQLAFVRGLTTNQLDQVLAYTNLKGNRFQYPLRSMLLHLVNHGTYHRGQVVTLLRQLGPAPAATDYLRYLDVLAGQPED